MLTLRTTATVIKINRKSSSPCFKNLQVGDVIEFSVPIVRVGRHRGTYATYILCHNCRTDVESQLSFNQIEKVLECCELNENQILYFSPNTNPVKIEFENEYNPKFELNTNIGFYTFEEDMKEENDKD